MAFWLLLLLVSHLKAEHTAEMPRAGRLHHTIPKSSSTSETWTFNQCKTWAPHVNRAEDDSAYVHLDNSKYADTIVGKLALGDSTEFDFSVTLLHLLEAKTYQNHKTWTSTSRADRNGEYHRVSVVFQEIATTQPPKKVIVIPTKRAKTSYESLVETHTVAMLSSTGQVVEAEIVLDDKGFKTYKILRVCGDGFGFKALLDGKTREVAPNHKFPSAALGRVNHFRHGQTPMGRNYTRNETALLQELLVREAHLLK